MTTPIMYSIICTVALTMAMVEIFALKMSTNFMLQPKLRVVLNNYVCKLKNIHYNGINLEYCLECYIFASYNDYHTTGTDHQKRKLKYEYVYSNIVLARRKGSLVLDEP